MLATGWGDCNHTKCNLNNIFHEGKGHFATGEWAFFVFSEGKIIAIIKKCNLNNMLHESKGHFATGERALWGRGPGSYAPVNSLFQTVLRQLGKRGGGGVRRIFPDNKTSEKIFKKLL
jgi:hypothetical protein